MTLITLIEITLSIIYLIIAIILLYYSSINNTIEKHSPKSLIKCPDCGKKVSIHADTCPKCNNKLLDKTKINELVIKDEQIRKYKKIKLFLIIYQLITGISIVFIYEKINSLFIQIIWLLSLIFNTISIFLFIIFKNKIRKNNKLHFSIISILAIICGIFFITNYAIVLNNHMKVENRDDIYEVILTKKYNKDEAKQILNNIYNNLSYDEYHNNCLELYGMWQDNNKEEYYINIKDTCKEGYLAPNSLKLIPKEDKTEIKDIYWQYNDEVKIYFYQEGQKVKNYKYIYLSTIYNDGLMIDIKDKFEQEVKEKLKSPSSAIFTYNSYLYDVNKEYFMYKGWVEAQNSFGAMVKEEFIITLLPCNNEKCENTGMTYTWHFN